MESVIITGITGQDGSYMLDYLLENTDLRVFGIVRRSSCPNYINIQKHLHNERLTLKLADLSDYHSIEQIVKDIQPSYFINLAAQSFVGASWDIPEQTFDITGLGVLRCLEAIRKHSPKCRFYSAGSSEEMGDVLYSPQDKEHPIRPRSPYGAAKAAARHIVKVYRESYGLYAVHGILYNHESPRRGAEFVTRKITLGVARLKKELKDLSKGLPAPIELGNLDAKRDWSHALDFVDGIWKMLNQPPELNHQNPDGTFVRGVFVKTDKDGKFVMDYKPKEYILSSGETHTVREFIEKAFTVADIPFVWSKGFDGKPESEMLILGDREHKGLATKRLVPLVTINPKFYRPAEVNLLWGDSSPARKELNWTPKISFDKLVEDMVLSDIHGQETSQAK